MIIIVHYRIVIITLLIHMNTIYTPPIIFYVAMISTIYCSCRA